MIERNAGGLALLFQSSSGQKAGCNRIPSEPRLLAPMFQSSSGQKAGCNVEIWWVPHWMIVSILIRPSGRMQPVVPGWETITNAVSILIRPEGRMQLAGSGRDGVHGQAVSILIRPEGRMQPRVGVDADCCRQCFNPHPARRPDATVAAITHYEIVSILIRPEGRMQLDSHPWHM